MNKPQKVPPRAYRIRGPKTTVAAEPVDIMVRLASISLILGIVGLFLALTVAELSLPFTITSFLLGLLAAISTRSRRGQAITGIILSVLGFIVVNLALTFRNFH